MLFLYIRGYAPHRSINPIYKKSYNYMLHSGYCDSSEEQLGLLRISIALCIIGPLLKSGPITNGISDRRIRPAYSIPFQDRILNPHQWEIAAYYPQMVLDRIPDLIR